MPILLLVLLFTMTSCNDDIGYAGTETVVDAVCEDSASSTCYTGPPSTEGIGVCAAGLTTCEGDAWGLCVGERQPSTETCDGLDNDCDGEVDEDVCTCVPGERADCYDGPEATADHTPCRPGTKRCLADGSGYGACEDQYLPTEEVCDQIDNDCDGEVDNGACACRPHHREPCYTGVESTQHEGLCREGSRVCNVVGSGYGACEDEVLPVPEICDGQDNNCDGVVDEGFDLGTECDLVANGCAIVGVVVCDPDGGAICSPRNLVSAQEEVCDGYDNDCDGEADEGLDCTCVVGEGRACYQGPEGTLDVGQCESGEQLCLAGVEWGVCTGATLPSPERCDGVDNDCNGQVDDGLAGVVRCATGEPGICAGGWEVCSDGEALCVPENTPGVEVCDGVDNDCDGEIDNVEGAGEACVVGLGLCENSATTSCVIDERGDWALVCVGTPLPSSPERCDNQDNDCDGVIDSGHVCPDTAVANTMPHQLSLYAHLSGNLQRLWPTPQATGLWSGSATYMSLRSDGTLFTSHLGSPLYSVPLSSADERVMVPTPGCGIYPIRRAFHDDAHNLHYGCLNGVLRNGEWIVGDVNDVAAVTGDGRIVIVRDAGRRSTKYVILDTEGDVLTEIDPQTNWEGDFEAVGRVTVHDNNVFLVFTRDWDGPRENVVFRVFEDNSVALVRRLVVPDDAWHWMVTASPDGNIWMAEGDILDLAGEIGIRQYTPDNQEHLTWSDHPSLDIHDVFMSPFGE